MATVDNMLGLLASADTLFDSHTDLALPASQIASNQQALATSMANQLMTLENMTLGQANEITARVRTSKFAESHKTSLAGAVARLDESCAAGQQQGKRSVTPTQHIEDPLSLFTQRHWELLLSEEKPDGRNKWLVCDVLKSLRCFSPSEDSYKRLASMLACCLWPNGDPSVIQMNQLMWDLKECMETHRSSSRIASHLKMPVIPADPSTLPNDIYAAAYPSGPRIKHVLPRYPEFCYKKCAGKLRET